MASLEPRNALPVNLGLPQSGKALGLSRVSASGNERLLLVCGDLRVAPQVDLPPGYRLKWYEPGDEEAWLRIHKKADKFTTFYPEIFRDKFGTDESLLHRRQVYVLADGERIGTVTAWGGELEGEQLGRVHWLAVLPEHRRKGLGRALLSIACERLREEGFRRAYLVTSRDRPGAIRLYLQFGFKPLRHAAG